MNIALSENSNVLDEVVVVGYGAVKKKRPYQLHLHGQG